MGLAQLVLEDLPHPVSWNCRNRENPLGHLVRSESSTRRLQETELVELGSRSHFKHRHDSLTEIRMRHAKDGRLGICNQTVENILDLPRIDIQAAGNDQVFQSPEQTNTTCPVDLRNVPRDEPSVRRESISICLGAAPIAGEYVMAARLEAANSFRTCMRTVFTRYADL